MPNGRDRLWRVVAAGQIERLLATHGIRVQSRGNPNSRRRFTWELRALRFDERSTVFGAKRQPLIVECAITSWAAFHNLRKIFGLWTLCFGICSEDFRPLNDSAVACECKVQSSKPKVQRKIELDDFEMTEEVRNLNRGVLVGIGTVRGILTD